VFAFGGKLDCCGWAEDDKPLVEDHSKEGQPPKEGNLMSSLDELPSLDETRRAAEEAADAAVSSAKAAVYKGAGMAAGVAGSAALNIAKKQVLSSSLGKGAAKLAAAGAAAGAAAAAAVGMQGVDSGGRGDDESGSSESEEEGGRQVLVSKMSFAENSGELLTADDALSVAASDSFATNPETVKSRSGTGLLKGTSKLGNMLAATLGRAAKPRLPPSAADPSTLAGQPVHSEEDILHLRQLPEFGGALRPADVEVLLQSLLMPYLRVPLLLRFFAEPARTAALAHRELQRTLDAAIFEPGEWQPADAPKTLPTVCSAHPPTRITLGMQVLITAPPPLVPQVCPAPDRRHLATAAGTLFQELTHSPSVVLGSVKSILENALELDPGRYVRSGTRARSAWLLLGMQVLIPARVAHHGALFSPQVPRRTCYTR
jgi:hypothetical protein